VTRWSEFAGEAPDLAGAAEERFERTGLALVGTLRADGWPRISPVEPLIADGQLYLGMMWQSRKALDLLRDPRCVVHSTVIERDGSEGDFKLYGRTAEVSDADEREHYCVALESKIGWRPDGDFHLFAVDIVQVGFVQFGDGRQVGRVWQPGSGVRLL
jgi:pyridoxamine 5'-phosphate oxidase-like protein